MTYAKVINGRLKEATEIKPIDMTEWIEVDIPMVNLRYEDGVFLNVPYVAPVVEVPVVKVPQSLTPRQIRMVLTANNLRTAVENTIAQSIDYDLKDWWEYSLEYLRDNPLLISMATSLGLTEEQVDNMFIQGATL